MGIARLFNKDTYKRIASTILAIVLAIPSTPLNLIDTHAESVEGVSVSIQWSGSGSADDIDWYATTSQSRNINLQVNYRFNKAKISKDGFEPGDIEIKIPGIGKVNRAYVKKASTNLGSGEAQVWELAEYDSIEDIYTFKNKRFIDSETSFAGQFTLSWGFSSRDIITESYEEVEGTVSAHGIVGRTNRLTFKFVSEVDTFDIGAYCAGFDVPDGLDGLIDLGEDPEDYWWVKLTVSPTIHMKSRGTKNTYYIAEFPENAVIRKATNSYEKLSASEYKLGYASTQTFWLTYPKDEVSVGEVLTHNFKLYGTYLDTTEEVLLAEDDVNITPSDYNFRYSGSVNSVGKSGSYTSGQNAIIKSRLYNGMTLPYYFSIRARYNYNTNNGMRKARRKVATSSNSSEDLDNLEFVAPNYLDTLSDEDLADEDKFREAMEEAQRLYEEALANYEDEVYERELEEKERLESIKEEKDEDIEDIEDIEDEELIDDVTIKESEKNTEESEEITEESEEEIESTEKETESIKEESENSIESETETETETEVEESSEESETEETEVEEEIIKDTETIEKIDENSEKELEIEKKEVNIVKYSLKESNDIATSSNAIKNEEQSIDNKIDTITAPESYGIEVQSEDNGMDIIIMDDFLEITSITGELVELKENEYRMTNIKIPSSSSFINANGFSVKAGKYDVEVWSGLYGSDDAKLVQSFKLGGARTINFPNNTTHCFVKIKGINESIYMSGMTLNVQFNLDKDNETLDNGKIRNLMGFITEQNGEITNIPSDSSYTGTDRERVRERDNDVYGHNIQRDLWDNWYQTDKVYHSISVGISGFKSTDDGYTNTISYRSSFNFGDGITGWSVYSLLPLGMEVDKSKLIQKASIAGFETENYDKIETLSRNQFKIEIEDDYKNSGRTLVKGIYNFDDETVQVSGSWGYSSFTIPVFVSYNSEDSYGTSYNVKAEQFLECPGKIVLPSNGCGSGLDNGKVFNEGEYWVDINNNGNINEKLVYSSTSTYILYTEPTHMEIKKFISAPRTYNKYVTNLVDKKMKDIWASFGCDYSYKLNIYNLGKPATNVILYDFIEQGFYIKDDDGNITEEIVDSKWIGKFRGVDTSYIEKYGFKPTIYYTSVENAERDIHNGQWSTNIPDGSRVTGIAVDFGSRKLISSKNLYIEVLMTAPEIDRDLIGLEAINEFSVEYRANGKDNNLDSNSVYLKIDEPKGIAIINKIDAVDKSELSNYKFEMYDSNNELVAIIKDDGMFNLDGYESSGVDIGKYRLKEIEAPEGYNITEDVWIDLTLEDTKKGFKTVTIEDPRKPGTVRLIKKDVSDESVLVSGAVFNLYKENENGDSILVKEYIETDNNGELFIDNLEWGTYYLEEIEAPVDYYLQGYLKTYFDINIESLEAEVETTNRHLGEVRLTKYDADQLDEVVDGAIYALYDKNNNYINSYETDINGEIHVTGLEWGRYYFIEEDPANGYEINSEKISFTVNKSNSRKVIEVNTEDLEKTASVKLVKTDDKTGEKLNGALYRLQKRSGDSWYTFETYKTDSLGEIEINGLKFGEYQLIEVKAPKGYTINNEPIDFKLDRSTVDTTINVKHTDEKKKGNIEIIKSDDAGDIVIGARFKIYKNDKEIAEIETNKVGIAKLDNLEWGEYTVKEVEPVPKGYILNTKEQTFTINRDNVDKTITVDFVNERQKGSVKLTKKRENSEDKLRGAVYRLCDINGKEINRGTTNENGEIIFKDIVWGSYYLEEVTAPDGYALSSEKIRLSINRDNCGIVQELEAEDKLETATIVIRKELVGEDIIWEDFGNPSFMFKISGYDVTGKYHEWFREITLSKENPTGFAVLEDIPLTDYADRYDIETGDKIVQAGYAVEELNSVRYTEQSVGEAVKASSSGAIIDIPEQYGYDDYGRFTVYLSKESIVEKDEYGNITNIGTFFDYSYADITFTNKLDVWDKYGHTSNAVNMVKHDRNYVYLNVEYTGPSDIFTFFDSKGEFNLKDNTEFLEKYVIVKAYYDSEDKNGNIFRVLSTDEYEIEPFIIKDPGAQSVYNYTIQVKHSEGGKTKSNNFQLQAKVSDHFYIVNYYDGEDLIRSERYAYGDKVRLYTIEDTIGARFIGWNLKGNEETYTDEYTNINNNKVIDFYALFDLDVYNIKYVGEGIFDESFKKTYTVKDTFELPVPKIDKMGRTFAGWTGSNSQTDIQKHVVIEKGKYAGDLQFRAHWDVEGATLLPGTEFSTVIDKLLNHTKITALRVVDTIPSNLVGTTHYNVAVQEHENSYTIDAYIDGTELYLYTEAPNIIFNKYSNNMFMNWTSLVDASDVEYFDTSKILRIYNMFNGCTNLVTVGDLSAWNTADVVNLGQMFFNCSKLTNIGDIGNWDTSKVTNIGGIFYNCKSLKSFGDLSDWNTSNVTNMPYVFQNCSSVVEIKGIDKWDVSKVTNMDKMFYYCSRLNNIGDLKNWNVSKVTNMDRMFYYCTNLKTIGDTSGWDASKASKISMFYNCPVGGL